MESTQGLPIEVRLSAYLDGQLPRAEMNEIDEILAQDDDARGVFEKLKLGSEFGARAFERMLQEPIPAWIRPSKCSPPLSVFCARKSVNRPLWNWCKAAYRPFSRRQRKRKVNNHAANYRYPGATAAPAG